MSRYFSETYKLFLHIIPIFISEREPIIYYI